MANSSHAHPYHPREVKIPHYVPNVMSIGHILGVFFGVVAVILAITWTLGTRKHMRLTDRLILCWMVCCGFIHIILEGYFAAYHATLAGGSSYLAEMWKEYGQGDSRYITSDTFVLCMESITAVIDGPLCFATAYAYLTNSCNRYVLLLVVSLCQLYGDTLYFVTEIKENFIHGDMYHPLHFWFYFVFLNSLWIVVPSILIFHSATKLCNAQSIADSKNRGDSKKKRR